MCACHVSSHQHQHAWGSKVHNRDGNTASHTASVAAPHRRGSFVPTCHGERGAETCMLLIQGILIQGNLCNWGWGGVGGGGWESLQSKPQSQLLFGKTAIIHPLKDQIIRKCIKPHLASHDRAACHSLRATLRKRSWTVCANLNHPTSGPSTFCSPLAVTPTNPTLPSTSFVTKPYT